MYHSLYRGVYTLGGFNYLGGIIMFIGIILAAVIIYLLIKNSKSKITFNNSDSSASILKERLANGDITPEEYDNILNKIKNS